MRLKDDRGESTASGRAQAENSRQPLRGDFDVQVGWSAGLNSAAVARQWLRRLTFRGSLAAESFAKPARGRLEYAHGARAHRGGFSCIRA